jgi:3-methylcrotonyl-CoA carboxylase beta subunit
MLEGTRRPSSASTKRAASPPASASKKRQLIDPGTFFQELGLWAAHDMYKEHGGAPAAGVVTGIGWSTAAAA